MGNIVDYVSNQTSSFESVPMNDVDSLVLACLAYLRFPDEMPRVRSWDSGMTVDEICARPNLERLVARSANQRDTRALLEALAASPRYAQVEAFGYLDVFDAPAEKQFAAISFHVAPDLAVASFRGTDSTLVGWKEDFNMAFQTPVPSQYEAQIYLEKLAEATQGAIVCTGHSKGGNLSVYAASNCKAATQARIRRAYSHDGPGFLMAMLSSEGFDAMRERVSKVVPESSVVGLLLESHEPYRVVRSNRVGVWQHDPFSWEVDGDDFVAAEKLDLTSTLLDQTLDSWILLMTPEEREKFVDALYESLAPLCKDGSSTQIWNLLRNDPTKVLEAFAQADPQHRQVITDTAGDLLASAAHSAGKAVVDGAADALGTLAANFLHHGGKTFRL